jgi:hypothetical protein
MANPFAKYAQPQKEEENPFAKYAAPQPPAAQPEEQNPFAKYAPAPTTTAVQNPFAVEGAPAEVPAEKSSLYEFPRAVVRGAINLQNIPAGIQQRQYALGMEAPDTALSAFDRIDAGELKSKKDINKFIGGDKSVQDLLSTESLERGYKPPGSELRAIGLAKDYLNASPEERKKIRAATQAELQENAKSFSEAVARGEEIKKQAEPYASRLKDFTDVGGIGDAGTYVASKLGEAIPQFGPVLASGLLFKTPGVVGTSIGMELGPATQDRVDFITEKIKNEPNPEKRVADVAKYVRDSADVTLMAATVSGLFDAVLGPEAEIAKKLLSGELRKQTRKEILTALPKAVAESGYKEGLTGALQEIVMINAERKLGEQTGDAFTKENIVRVVDSALSEAIGGLGISTTMEGARAIKAKKDTVQTATREGEAIRGLDALAEQEERTKAAAEDTTSAAPPAARTLDNLTQQEVEAVQRRLFAELGRPAEEPELLEAFNEYLAEQNAGLGIESGTNITSVSDTGAEQPAGAAGISDTGAAATSDTGGLGASGVSTDQLTDRTTEQPSTLDTMGKTDLRSQFLQMYDEYQELDTQSGNLEDQLSQLGVNTFKLEDDLQVAREKQQQAAALQNLDPTAAAMIGERQLADLLAQVRLTNYESRLLEGDASTVVDNYLALKGQMAALDSQMDPVMRRLDELDATDITEEDVEAAAPKSEEVITKEVKSVTDVKEAERIADKLFNEDLADAWQNLQSLPSNATEEQRAEAQRLYDEVSDKWQAASDRVNELREGKDTQQGGGIFKSLSSTPSTYISPVVGLVPTNKFGINRLNKLYSDGKISAQEYADGMIKLYEELEDKAATKSMSRGLKKERGLGAVIKALEDAVKKGRISKETAEFAKWLLLQNPAIANDLAISIKIPQTVRAQEQNAGVAGFYSDMARLVRIITRKNEDGKYLATPSDVAVHEILHHMERMLPTELRALIREEWKVRVQKAMDKAVKENKLEIIKYLALVVNGNAAQSSGVMQEAENMIKDGKVPHSYYGLINTSEFWAVNGSNILAGRYGAETRLEKLRQYVKEFIEKIKSIFGLETDDPIIRGLNAVLKGDGTFLQKRMLADSRGGQYSPSLDTSGKEQQLIEQFRRAGDLQPDVVAAIQNNDLNGALNILANRLGGFYGELAAKLASLNLQTSIAFDNGNNLTYRAVEQIVGPQLQRVMNYMRVADPDYYDNWFKDFDRPENLIRLRTGINTLYFDTVIAKGKGKHSFTEIANEIKDVSDAIYKYDVTGAAGAYYNLFDAISLNTKRMEGMGNRVFLHEVVHAATVSILRADPSQLTKEQLEAREEIEKLYRLAQRNIKVGEYGLTNKFEFLAELFTNEEFQKLLKAIPYPAARTNVLSRFFSAVLRLVGADNLASRAMVEAEKLFTPVRYQETKPIGPLFAQGPKKKRVRGPISTPDTYRTANENQNTLLGVIKDAASGQMQWSDARKILIPAVWEAANVSTRKSLLYVANLTQLEDITRTKFSQLTGALKIIRNMVAYRAKKLNVASDITRRWVAAQSKNYNQSQLMGRIMLEATIRGIDPDTAQAGTLNKPLQDAWNTLDPEFKQIYRDVRNFYTDSVNEMIREMKLRANQITDSTQRAELLRKIDAQFGPDKLIKPYFPMRRFGQYWFQVGSGNFKEFYEFESPVAREIAMRKRIAQLSKR